MKRSGLRGLLPALMAAVAAVAVLGACTYRGALSPMSQADLAIERTEETVGVWIDPGLEALVLQTHCAAHTVMFDLGDEVARQVRAVLSRRYVAVREVPREDADLSVVLASIDTSVDVRIQLFTVEGNIWLEIALDLVAPDTSDRAVGRGYVEGEIGDACTSITPLFDAAARQAIEALAEDVAGHLQGG